MDAGGGGVFVNIPFDVNEVYGTRGRVKVKATIDGIHYRGSIMNMGTGCHILGILKEIRKKIGKEIGDYVSIVLEEDTEPRVVEIPDYFSDALNSFPDAKIIFENYSYSHKKEYIDWISSAKKPETRLSRIKKAIDKLQEQVKK